MIDWLLAYTTEPQPAPAEPSGGGAFGGIILIVILMAIFLSVGTYIHAKNQNKSAGLWAVVVLFLGIVGLVFYAISLSSSNNHQRTSRHQGAQMPTIPERLQGTYVTNKVTNESVWLEKNAEGHVRVLDTDGKKVNVIHKADFDHRNYSCKTDP